MMHQMASCHKVLLVVLLIGSLSHISSTQSSGSASASGSNGSGSASVDASLSLGGSSGSGGSGGGASVSASGSVGGGSGGESGGLSGSASFGNGGGSSSPSQAGAGSASSSINTGSATAAGSAQAYAPSTPKPEGLFSKMKEMVKSSVENLTHDSDKRDTTPSPPATGGATLGSGESGDHQGSSSQGGLMDKLGDATKRGKEMIKEAKDDVKSALKPGETSVSGNVSAGGSVKMGGVGSAEAKVQVGGEKKIESPLSKLVSKGSDMMHKVEDKASEIGQRMMKPVNEVKASAQVKVGSGSISGSVSGGSESKYHSESHSSGRDDKSVTVDVLDKTFEISKAPVEHALKPIDKALGYKEDPLIKILDTSHELIRKPLSAVSKPVESVLSGAFKTTEEAKQEQMRMMSDQERREIRLREEKARKEGRSILGEITDRTVELAEKPFEIILKPVDRALGFDKDGKKNPLIQLIDEIYGLSKKPIDALAKPFENILRKMAEGEYQVSVRYNPDSSDPKLFTRLADGALNIADRVVTRPLEIVMRPLGYNERRGHRNPIVDAAHSLKNATKVGFELFTKPIDRIIKEIADIGAIKDDAQREAEIERKRQEASRIVSALDKLHEVAQTPFEIVLRPVGRALGFSREGKKEPLLRAWDVVHQVVRTPIQVISRPVEDALLGESKRSKLNVKGEVQIGKKGISAEASVNSGGHGGSKATADSVRGAQSDKRKNFFVEQIKKVEKFAVKPLDIITSPIRKLILGEDDKIGGKTNGNGKGIQAKAQVGSFKAQANIPLSSSGGGSSSGTSGNHPDKIVKTIEKINNVMLRPLEMVTQPLSDSLATDDGKLKSKIDVKVQGSTQMRGQEKASVSASASAGSGSGSGSQGSSIQGSASIGSG